MPSFWSLISNGDFSIGCTGQTVHLYDKNRVEVAKFKDLSYAYTAAISPRNDLFAVKSGDGRMAVYGFDPPALITKFRYSKVRAAQDDPFCFSPDGSECYSIERHVDCCQTALSIYDTRDFSLKRRILSGGRSMNLSSVEFDEATGEIYLLGFFRDDSGVADQFFVGKLQADALAAPVLIPEKVFHFYREYFRLRMMGFTEKAYEWSYMQEELDALRNAKYTLSQLWSSCFKK